MGKKLTTWLGKIHNADCVSGMNALPGQSVDLIFADPPFNIGYEYDEYIDRLESENYVDWSHKWMREVHRILKVDGTFWLAIGDEYAAELKVAAHSIGFHCRSWVIWYYTFGVHCTHKFTRSHAHLFHFVKDSRNFVFNHDSPELRVPSARQLVYHDSRANAKGRMPDDTWILRPQDLVDGFNPDEDVWYFPRVAGTFKERAGFHGCQMPEQLLGRIIRSCSNVGDIVVDPFAGSSTTLAVAKKLGRNYFGFELSKEYVKLGTRRLEGICVGDHLDGAEEPKVSAPSTVGGKRAHQKLHSKKACTSDSIIAAQPRAFLADLAIEAKGVLEAFANTNRGFSVDRVVADPILNEDFQLACNQLAISGIPADRNRFLFRLRKSGKIKALGINTTQRTNLDWDYVSDFVFASEIAWRHISNSYCGLSLDDIFCDPRIAIQFDQAAARFAPGFQPLDYRWGALKLRKQDRNMKRRAEMRDPKQLGIASLNKKKIKEHEGIKLDALDLASLPRSPGVYLLRVLDGDSIYAGETTDLKTRLRNQFAPNDLRSQYSEKFHNLNLVVLPTDAVVELPFACQTLLTEWHKPIWNPLRVLSA